MGRRSTKKFDFAEGKFYFNVQSGHQNVTINRSEQKEAEDTFKSYMKLGKKVEWLGKWNGKKFIENKEPVL